MKILPIILLLTTSLTTWGQVNNERDLVDILNVALRDNKLPTELIRTTNSKMAPWTNAPFIVVKSDTSKNLKRLKQPPDGTHVWIFDYEDIFMLEIAYGLVPLDITRNKDQLTLDFKTIRFPSKESTSTCHSGRLVANREGNSWTIVKTKVKEVKCEIDLYGHKK